MDKMTKAAFLDRDGTIIEDLNYIGKPKDVILIKGAPEALKLLHELGFVLVIISNQAGVARGYFTEKAVASVNKALDKILKKYDVKIKKHYYCPHHKEFGNKKYKKECSCRKPEPGLILKAAQELNLDISQSIMIGDKRSDVEAGINAKTLMNYLVKTGKGAEEAKKLNKLNKQVKVYATLKQVAMTLKKQKGKNG